MYSAIMLSGFVVLLCGSLCAAELVAIFLEKKCPAIRRFFENHELDEWCEED